MFPQKIQLIAAATRQNDNVTGIGVAYPARHAQPARLLRHEPAKTNTLNYTPDSNVQRLLGSEPILRHSVFHPCTPSSGTKRTG
jgi:hypothetical protein